MKRIAPSELIVNPDGSIYHLHLHPEQLADTVLVVGDPGRVPEVSKHFDRIDHKVSNREMVTNTGWIGTKHLTVLSSGMGTDNIDIVMNELDALVNIDLKERTVNENHKQLTIIRVGTSGGLHPDIPTDSMVASSYGIGLDGLLYFYSDYAEVIDEGMTRAFIDHTAWPENLPRPYAVAADPALLNLVGKDIFTAITCTSPGFYAPQGRQLRLKPTLENISGILSSFKYQERTIGNFEMETSALYGLGRLLGHRTLTVCTIVANRYRKEFSQNYKASIERLIVHVLDRVSR
ncbi:MAG: nucleoside phosphorylase [Bacteroidota bacterium]|nr:nucleoside phosphorylase [Bacteroidota bacterium]